MNTLEILQSYDVFNNNARLVQVADKIDRAIAGWYWNTKNDNLFLRVQAIVSDAITDFFQIDAVVEEEISAEIYNNLPNSHNRVQNAGGKKGRCNAITLKGTRCKNGKNCAVHK